MAPTSTGTPVVSTWTDASLPTGEFYARTADGRTWRVYGCGNVPRDQTGVTRGWYSNGAIK